MGQFEPGEPSNGGVTVGMASEPEVGNFVYTIQPMSQTAQFSEYIASQVNSILFGWVRWCVVSLTTGMLTEAQVARTPIGIVKSRKFKWAFIVEIEAPSLSAYREAVQSLLAGASAVANLLK